MIKNTVYQAVSGHKDLLRSSFACAGQARFNGHVGYTFMSYLTMLTFMGVDHIAT